MTAVSRLRQAGRSRSPLGSPSRSVRPAASFWHDRGRWEGQPSLDGTVRTASLGTFDDRGGAHLFAGTSGERFRCNVKPLRMQLFKAEGAIRWTARSVLSL